MPWQHQPRGEQPGRPARVHHRSAGEHHRDPDTYPLNPYTWADPLGITAEMRHEELAIGGLVVPPVLDALIDAGKWVPPSIRKIYLDIFGDGPEHSYFYDRDKIIRENSSWQSLSAEEVFWSENEEGSLGIELRKSIAIADLGPDIPIVLDYRESRDSPHVLYLGYFGKPKNGSRLPQILRS